MNKAIVIAVVAAFAFVGLSAALAEPASAYNGCTLYKRDEITVYDPTTGEPMATVPVYDCAW